MEGRSLDGWLSDLRAGGNHSIVWRNGHRVDVLCVGQHAALRYGPEGRQLQLPPSLFPLVRGSCTLALSAALAPLGPLGGGRSRRMGGQGFGVDVLCKTTTYPGCL